MNEHIQLIPRNLFIYKQKKGKVNVRPRTYAALTLKASAGGRYLWDGTVTEYQKGALCLVPADIAYRRDHEAEDIYVIHFDTVPLLPRKILVLQLEDVEAYREKFQKAIALWQEKEPGYYYRVSAILYDFFAEIVSPLTAAQPEGDYLDKVKCYMEEHFSDATLTVDRLVRCAHVSAACLRRRFAERYGTAPKQYLDRLRIEHAKSLLQTGYYSTREIAERCGFADVGYFCTAFRRHVGTGISAYRKGDN